MPKKESSPAGDGPPGLPTSPGAPAQLVREAFDSSGSLGGHNFSSSALSSSVLSAPASTVGPPGGMSPFTMSAAAAGAVPGVVPKPILGEGTPGPGLPTEAGPPAPKHDLEQGKIGAGGLGSPSSFKKLQPRLVLYRKFQSSNAGSIQGQSDESASFPGSDVAERPFDDRSQSVVKTVGKRKRLIGEDNLDPAGKLKRLIEKDNLDPVVFNALVNSDNSDKSVKYPSLNGSLLTGNGKTNTILHTIISWVVWGLAQTSAMGTYFLARECLESFTELSGVDKILWVNVGVEVGACAIAMPIGLFNFANSKDFVESVKSSGLLNSVSNEGISVLRPKTCGDSIKGIVSLGTAGFFCYMSFKGAKLALLGVVGNGWATAFSVVPALSSFFQNMLLNFKFLLQEDLSKLMKKLSWFMIAIFFLTGFVEFCLGFDLKPLHSDGVNNTRTNTTPVGSREFLLAGGVVKIFAEGLSSLCAAFIVIAQQIVTHDASKKNKSGQDTQKLEAVVAFLKNVKEAEGLYASSLVEHAGKVLSNLDRAKSETCSFSLACIGLKWSLGAFFALCISAIFAYNGVINFTAVVCNTVPDTKLIYEYVVTVFSADDVKKKVETGLVLFLMAVAFLATTFGQYQLFVQEFSVKYREQVLKYYFNSAAAWQEKDFAREPVRGKRFCDLFSCDLFSSLCRRRTKSGRSLTAGLVNAADDANANGGKRYGGNT